MLKEKKLPWIKWYPSDWRAEPKLRMCSLAARGLWVDLLSYMHEGEPYGYLTIHGVLPSTEDIASLVSRPVAEVRKALAELDERQVFSRDETTGAIFSRRMIRDRERAREDCENGKLGGNPYLKNRAKRGVNPPDKAQSLEARDQTPEARIQTAETRNQNIQQHGGGGGGGGVCGSARRHECATVDPGTLADHIAELCGYELGCLPPAWVAGRPAMHVQTWLDRGWDIDSEIIPAVKAALATKRDGSPTTINYFEQCIARFIARVSAPLPTVESQEHRQR